MTENANDPTEVVRRYIEEVLNGRQLDLADELLDPRLKSQRVAHGARDLLASRAGLPRPPHPKQGAPVDLLAAFKRGYAALVGSFPDMHNEIIGPMMADGDLVATRLRISGTHEGDFFGLAPTHKKITYDSVVFMRVVDGKIAEIWALSDELDQLQQLGVLESPSYTS